MDKINRLKVVLAERDMSVGDFSELAEVNRVTASRWINNRAQPSLEKLHEIANKLQVHICDLLHKNEIKNTGVVDMEALRKNPIFSAQKKP